jgi:hypothetical protein
LAAPIFEMDFYDDSAFGTMVMPASLSLSTENDFFSTFNFDPFPGNQSFESLLSNQITVFLLLKLTKKKFT